MITANASLEGPSSAFILKRSNITFNYEVVFIYLFETNIVTTNGRWFAVSDSNSTLVFQLDSNYDMINEQRLPINGEFINLQRNDVLVLVRDGSISSYQLNQGQWQSIDSLTIPSASPFRVNFLEDKLVIGWPAGPSSEQICRFYQRNDTSWYLIEELQISFAAVSKALAWNGNDTLLVMNRIMVKQGGLWTTQAYLSSSDSSIYNAAFITETSFIVNEFRAKSKCHDICAAKQLRAMDPTKSGKRQLAKTYCGLNVSVLDWRRGYSRDQLGRLVRCRQSAHRRGCRSVHG
jgi:hypothetical protein